MAVTVAEKFAESKNKRFDEAHITPNAPLVTCVKLKLICQITKEAHNAKQPHRESSGSFRKQPSHPYLSATTTPRRENA
jgi:hypothetical protein